MPLHLIEGINVREAEVSHWPQHLTVSTDHEQIPVSTAGDLCLMCSPAHFMTSPEELWDTQLEVWTVPTDLWFQGGSPALALKHGALQPDRCTHLAHWCWEADRFNSKSRMPEARIVLKEEHTHACPVGILMPSTIRFQDALLIPLKQLQIIGGWECKTPCKEVYSEKCKLLF